MESIIALLLQYLPKQVEAIKLLQLLPDAVATVTELTAYVKRVIEFLQRDAPLTEEQEAELDAIIDKHKEEPWWQPDPTVPPAPAS